MSKWYNVFSYWSFVFFLASPRSARLVTILSLLGTFAFLSLANTTPPVAIFLLAFHVLPVWLLRKQPIQLKPTLLLILAYLTFLALQGLDPVKVYRGMIEEPPLTISEYLKKRFYSQSLILF